MIIQDGQIKYKYDYKYGKDNYIKKIITYLYNSQEPFIIKNFYYNEKGSVIKKKTKDYKTNEKNINKYFYKYEFYQKNYVQQRFASMATSGFSYGKSAAEWNVLLYL